MKLETISRKEIMSKPSKETLIELSQIKRYTLSKISKDLNIKKSELLQLFHEFDLMTPIAFIKSLRTKAYFTRCIEEGKFIKQISKELKMGTSGVIKCLDKYELQTEAQKRTRELDRFRTLPLSPKIKGIIVGTVLGDGCIQYNSSNRISCSLSFRHSIDQKNYAYYKAKVLLKELFDQEEPIIYKARDIIIAGKAAHIKDRYNWCSKTNDYLTWLRKSMYGENNHKEVTPESLEDLTLFGAAIWFADDGSLNKGNGKGVYRISTCGFSLESVKLLREWLFKHAKVKSTPIKQKKGFELYISAASRENFEKYIGVWVKTFPDVAYKVRDMT